MTDKLAVTLIGAGAMGGALLRGWLNEKTIDPARSAVFDPAAPEAMKALCAEYGLALNPEIDVTRADVLVAAVKPQTALDALPQYAPIAKNAIVISVMAGKSIASISKALGGAPRVMRAMPNLPAAIGKGVSGLFAPGSIDIPGRTVIETLMAAAGDTVWVETEEQIDFVTAVSGSGPAYYFLMTEALAQAGEALGLKKDTAAALARATLSGAGALMEVDTRSPAEMRRAVTSPGGTTQAALKVLDGEEKSLRKLIESAIEAAKKRSAELTD
jgi:pyrroline-5-carboxylate reductase